MTKSEVLKALYSLRQSLEIGSDAQKAMNFAISAFESQSEIIRCKNCKNWKYFKVSDTWYSTWCGLEEDGDGWEEDDFCSRAERREDGQAT